MFLIRFTLPLAAFSILLAGCHGTAQTEIEPEPAVGQQPSRVKLSAEKQRRVALEVVKAERGTVSPKFQTIGWLEIPSGQEVVVRAPVSGFLAKVGKEPPAALGSQVQRGDQPAFLQVFLSPTEIAQLVQFKEDADIQIEQSQVSMQLAEKQLKQLDNSQGAVSGVRIDQLREQFERSKAALRESKEKLPFLIPEPYTENMPMKPVKVEIPLNGRVSHVHAVVGQLVMQGDPIWTISDWSELWLRVPVFESEVPLVRRDLHAALTVPGTQRNVDAKWIDLPVSTRPQTRTVDLLLSVENRDLSLRPGQGLSVSLRLTGKEEAVTVPRSAIIYDGFGNSFVYVRESQTQFHRRRIELGPPEAAGCTVIRGLSGGEDVVSTGAQILYAEEFKSGLAVEDND